MFETELFNKVSSEIEYSGTQLYYYLPLSVFVEHVIQENKLVLWAGHVDCMEDVSEFKIGAKYLKDYSRIDKSCWLTVTEGIKNRYPFQLSLSSAYDDYTMWNIHGGNDLGVMLIFNYNELEKAYPQRIKKCIYTHEAAFNDALAVISSIGNAETRNKDIMDFFILFPYLVKDSHYKFEEEVRIFHILKRHLCDADKGIHFQCKGQLLKQFKEIKLNKNILQGVMLGPCDDKIFEMNSRNLEELLHRNGFTHIFTSDCMGNSTILKSEIQIRK